MVDPDAALARETAAHLLAIGAVTLSPEAPFTWASGLRAPIYCDNRLTMAYPPVRRALSEGFAEILRGHDLSPEVIVGTATAGIPHAAWLAQRLDLPMAYVRAAAKAHGRGNQIEGLVEPGRRVAVVEDLVSTGGSSLAVVEVLQAAGAEVEAMLAIFTYGLPGSAARFAEAGVPLYTLTHFEALLAVAEARQHVSPDAVASLRAWQRDPAAWSQAHGG